MNASFDCQSEGSVESPWKQMPGHRVGRFSRMDWLRWEDSLWMWAALFCEPQMFVYRFACGQVFISPRTTAPTCFWSWSSFWIPTELLYHFTISLPTNNHVQMSGCFAWPVCPQKKDIQSLWIHMTQGFSKAIGNCCKISPKANPWSETVPVKCHSEHLYANCVATQTP